MSALPPAAWYPDPERPGMWRYWDGAGWTSHRSPMAQPQAQTHRANDGGALAGDGSAQEARPPADVADGRRRGRLRVLAVSVAAAALLLGGAWAFGNQSKTNVGVAPSGATTPAATPAQGTSGADSSATTSAAAEAASPSSPAPTSPGGILVDVLGVVDGDTIKVSVSGTTERVRVIGIDTPELNPPQCYGQKAASKMQSLVQSKQVLIASDSSQGDRDSYGRLLRHVSLPDGQSVAFLLIQGGYGKEFTYDKPYSGQADYRAAQADAQAAGRGLWGAECSPAVGAQSATGAPPAAAGGSSPTSGVCLIKGNISSSGEKIYHVPGQRYYDETKIDTSKGERWFCSTAEAEAAGWRAAKV
jgi:micrococcal nuclease